MSTRRGETRAAMVRTASSLLQERGAGSTSIDKVLARSRAPRGSVYHHFPGGRTQLLGEALDHATAVVEQMLAEHAEAGPQAALDAFVAFWRERLLASDFRAGCPVLALAVDQDPDHPELAAAAGTSFDRWQTALADLFTAHGMTVSDARRLAVESICLLEGAVALCRARRDLEPLEIAAGAIRALSERSAG